VAVTPSELAPPAPSPACECVPLLEPMGGATLACGWGDGGNQFGRLERKPGTLSTLWLYLFVRAAFYVIISRCCHCHVVVRQGVTKRCRLSLLTNSALVYESKFRGEGVVAGCQPLSTAVHITWHGAQINFGDLLPYLTYVLRRFQMREEGELAGPQPMSTAVHITWHGAQIICGNLPLYI
jgi:hypothetical protein